MPVTSHQEDKQRDKDEKTAAKLQKKKRKFQTLKGFGDLKRLFTGLGNHCFKQQKENQLVITKKNNEPNQKLTKQWLLRKRWNTNLNA